MGTVWRAQDQILGREIAIKELIAPPELTESEREIFSLRTFREARAAGRVSHAGVATVYDVFEENGHPWIVLQLVHSDTLGAVVRDHGPLPPARVAEIGLQVLSALRAAHQAGVLHRDVKPDNVLLAHETGRAVLTDFGIATLDDDSSVTRTGTLIGTPAFIAPERAAGGQAVRASDLWSLGVTLYVAVEGRSPFQRGNPLITLGAVMNDPPAPLRLAGPLTTVLMGLLRKDPAERFTIAEAEDHLRMVVAGTHPEPTAPVPLPAVPVPAPEPAPAPDLVTPAAVPPQARPAGPGGRGIALAGLTALVISVGLVAGGLAWVTARSSGATQTPATSPTVRVTVSVTSSAEPVTRRTPSQSSQPSGRTPYSSRPSSTAPAPKPTPTTGPPKPDKTKDKGDGGPTGKPSGKPSAKPTKSEEKDPGDAVPPDEGEAGPRGHSPKDHDGKGTGDGRAVLDGGVLLPPGV